MVLIKSFGILFKTEIEMGGIPQFWQKKTDINNCFLCQAYATAIKLDSPLQKVSYEEKSKFNTLRLVNEANL